MAIRWGDTGKVVVGTKKTYTFTPAIPREDNIVLNPSYFVTDLYSAGHTTEATAYSAKITIQESDLPVITPSPKAMKYCAFFLVGGYNYNAAQQSVVTRPFFNGVQQQVANTHAIATNSRNWTHTIARFPDVKVGDELDAKMWALGSGISFECIALMIVPTQVKFFEKNTILTDVYVSASNGPSLSQNWVSPINGLTNGTWSTPNAQAPNIYWGSSNATSGFFVQLHIAGNYTIPAISSNLDYFLRMQAGDVGPGTTNYTHSSLKYYQRPMFPVEVSFREVLR